MWVPHISRSEMWEGYFEPLFTKRRRPPACQKPDPQGRRHYYGWERVPGLGGKRLIVLTVKGRLPVALKAPPALAANTADRLNVDVDATALLLPVNVSFQTIAPVELNAGALHDAVMYFGNPDTMLIVDPAAPLAATNPPTGVSVIVAVVVEAEAREIAPGDRVITAPGAACTCSFKGWLTLRPSPATVTVIVADATAAVADAVSVNVSLLELVPVAVCGFADHFAVIPTGSPLTA